MYLRQIGFFEPMERRVHLFQKVLKYTAVQKLEMLFVGLLAGIKAVSHTATMVLDVDLSPLPASRAAEGSQRGYMDRCRSKTGRKLVRVRAAATGEIVWESVISARTTESLPVLQEAIQRAEHRLGLQGDDEEVQRKRARTEIRLDSGWGSEGIITWLLNRRSLCEHSLKQHQ